MKILLMRHGVTAANQKKLYNGRTDDPLCAEGIEQAVKSGTDPKIKSLYASPMKRAVETAKIKFPNAEITICGDLREMDFGDFEGRGFSELKDDAEYQRWFESGGTLECPNGEKMSDFGDRVCRTFDDIVRKHIRRKERQLVIVAHGGSLMAILGRFGRPERPYHDWYVENCCGYRVHIDEDNWTDSPALTYCQLFETI